jgi:hypothetical protein
MDPIGSVGRGWLIGDLSVPWCRGQVAGTSTPMSAQAGARDEPAQGVQRRASARDSLGAGLEPGRLHGEVPLSQSAV